MSKPPVYSRRLLFGTYRGQRGFTIVEMGISVTLFLVVFVTAVSAVVAISSVSKRMQNIVYAATSMGQIFDEITVTSRLATEYSCGVSLNPSAVSCSDTAFTFQSRQPDGTEGPVVTYRFDPDSGIVEKRLDSGSFSQISPDSLTVEYMNFYVYDGAAGDSQPARVQMTLGGTYQKDSKEEIVYNLQTTVTQRIVE